jgi:cell division protein FtsB
MTTSKSKHHWRRFFRITAATFTLLFAAWFVFGQDGLWKSRQLRQKKLVQERQILQLKEQRQQLEAYLHALQNGDELAMQRAAREHGFVAPDETIYDVKVEGKKQ